MPELTITPDGLGPLIAKIDARIRQAAAGGLLAGGAHIKAAMATYAAEKRLTRASIYGKSFVSDRQRKFFFYALKAGIIHVPYRRTKTLGNRWTVAASDDGLIVEVGNLTPYGPLVQGAGTQTKYMQAVGWQTDEQVLAKEGPAVVAYVKKAIGESLGE